MDSCVGPGEIEALRAAVEPELSASCAAVHKWCNTETFRRYLVARQGNVAKAAAMLRCTLAWRQHFQPEAITWSDIAHNASTPTLGGSSCWIALPTLAGACWLKFARKESMNDAICNHLGYSAVQTCTLVS